MHSGSKYMILVLLALAGFSAHGQDAYMEKVDKYRKEFYHTFFETEFQSENLYNHRHETYYTYNTKDSLEKPRKAELYGMQYLVSRSIVIKTKLKKRKLPAETRALEDHFHFVRRQDLYYKDIDPDKELTEALEMSLDSAIRSDMARAAQDPANGFQVRAASMPNGKTKYYLTSSKVTILVKVRIKKKDLRHLKSLDHSIHHVEMWAVTDLFGGQYCTEEWVCHELWELK